MSDKYKLEGKRAVPVADLMEWARWLVETADRRVAHDEIGPFRVSTVFLGLDHRSGYGPPLVFETMIFGPGELDQWQERSSTWEQAEAMHEVATALARGAMN